MKYIFNLLTISVIFSLISACNSPANQKEILNKDSIISIDNNGVKIAFTDTGKSDTTLLFVHGWAINKEYWANQVLYFSKKYRVVTIDLPGFGQSGKNRDKWDTDTYSSDISSVINALDLKKIILIGHSMSGDIALQATVNNPNKIIALVGVDNFTNVGAPQNPDDKKDYAAAISLMKQNFKKTAFQYFNQSLFSNTTSPAIKKRILNDVAHTDSTIAIASMEQQDIGFDEINRLKKTGKKLYLINSDINPIVTKYMVAQNIPFEIYYTKGTGHYAMIENPDEFNKLLAKVIADINN
jgi:pimeloyl-ACP methyl ester carboxylesterase